MDFSNIWNTIKIKLNDNQGPIAGIVVILMILQMFGFQINIFSWPALFTALPLESKVWYLWIFNVFLTVTIGIFLLNSITKNADENQKKIIALFNSEIIKIEKNLNSVPHFETDSDMIRYVVGEFVEGKTQIFQYIPVYSQYSKEIMHFNAALREKLSDFYETIQTIQKNENFNFTSGTTPNIYQIRAYFNNVKKAREQLPELKQILEKEMV
jgi:hypothetical protein